jgi:4-amino-4-deoxy-L-arabinose transferase-like glycosyltransferase
LADTITTITQVEPDYSTESVERHSPIWPQLALVGITLISVFMNFFQLGQNGFGNLYYAAGVRSMLNNWHNFFFVSYDPGGFVTLDKPPLGFWLQVASARLFGFTPFSVFLPQALAGVLSVILLYYLVRRHFGVAAGLLAALALALSPISVVTNRNITIDSTLALTLLVGAWAVLLAAETGRLRWLLLSAAMVGIGFNIKMLEAYLVVPAYGLLYLLAAPKSLWKRIVHLALAALVLLAISLSWLLAVDLTPASQRPYVGSSQDNSELSLAIGYNGINRLLGQFGGGFGRGRRPNAPGQPNPPGGNGRTTPTINWGATVPPTMRTNGNAAQEVSAGFGGVFETGTPGPLRLFTEPLAGQIAWLLPLALLGMIALAWQRRLRLRSDRQQQSLVLWGVWLLTMGIFFSVAGFFHQYYLTEMAPAICALFGIGIVVMWQDYRRSGWRGWLLPLALIATVAEQVYILNSYPTWGQWLIPFMVVLCTLAVGVLLSARIAPHIRVVGYLSPRQGTLPGGQVSRFIASVPSLLPALSAGILALMLAPTVWAAIPVIQNTTAQLPVAGPAQRGDFAGNFGGRRGADFAQGGNFGGGDENANANPTLIRYLEANQGNTTYLVATPSSMTADGIILATNKPVMAMGGFSGSDPILTTSQLATLVAKGTVRFFLLGSFGGGRHLSPQILDRIPEQFRDRVRGGFGGGGSGQQGALTTWVTQHCKVVPTSLWQSSSTGAGFGGGFGLGGANQLYDCAMMH